MEVDAPQARQLQQQVAEELPVGHHDERVDAEPGERLEHDRRVDADRGEHRDAERDGELLDGAGLYAEVPPLAAVGLGDDGDDLGERTVGKGGQERARERVGTHEDDAKSLLRKHLEGGTSLRVAG